MATIAKKADIHREIEGAFGQVPTWLRALPTPALEGVWSLMRDFYLADTKIPGKYKELIGIAVSGVTGSKYCSLFHTENARLHGATDEEIAEASVMGSLVSMNGTYANAMQVDYKRFHDETLAIVAHVKAHGAMAGKGTAKASSAAEHGKH
jgi:AhpD family alkylhydroperoxidase